MTADADAPAADVPRVSTAGSCSSSSRSRSCRRCARCSSRRSTPTSSTRACSPATPTTSGGSAASCCWSRSCRSRSRSARSTSALASRWRSAATCAARCSTASPSFSAQDVAHFGAPSLITRITNDVTQVQILVLMSCTLLVAAPITIVGGVILAVREDGPLSLLLLVSVPVLVICVGLVISRMIPQFQVMQDRIDRINEILREQITGIRVVRAFVREPDEAERFAARQRRPHAHVTPRRPADGVHVPDVMLVLNVSSVAAIWLGRQSHRRRRHAGRRADRVPQLPDPDPHVRDDGDVRRGARAARVGERGTHRGGPRHRVVGRRARRTPSPSSTRRRRSNFATSSSGTRAPTTRCSATSRSRSAAGQTTAIIGSTGAGKTTLLNLVPRLFDATGGAVHRRRRRRARHRARAALEPHRPRAAEAVPLLRHGREQPALRQPRRHRRRALAGARDRAGARAS